MPRRADVIIEAPEWKIRRLAELRAEVSRRAKQAATFESPGELAKALDPATVQTPALEVIDRELIAVRDAIAVMFQRRARYQQLVDRGMDVDDAAEQAAEEIAAAGNNRLIVSAPPQDTGKSQRITRYGLLWLMQQFPKLRIGIVSFDGEVASRFSWQIRGDIELFTGGDNIDLGLRLVTGQKAQSRWTLRSGGSMYAIGIGGGLTSRPLDLLCIDDPIKDYRAADSLLLSAQAWEWWSSVARPRLAPWAPVIEVATAWHELDLRGRMLAKQAQDEKSGAVNYDMWRLINIPAQADHHPERGEVDILGREPGEFMQSARGRTRADWEATKAATPARTWSALFQGRPTPEEGDLFKRAYWQRYDTPKTLLYTDGTMHCPGADEVIQSWDMAFKDRSSSDFVVGQVWARFGNQAMLIDQVRGRWSFTETCSQLTELSAKWPQALGKLVEDKANGTAVIDQLKKTINGLIPINPGSDSKYVRALAVTPFIEARQVHIPSDTLYSWAADFVEEAAMFPNSSHDDQVDTMTQALGRLLARGSRTVSVASPVGLQTVRAALPRAIGLAGRR